MKIKYSKQSSKFLKKTEKESLKRILEHITKLTENPFPSDMKRVEGYKEKLYRIRVGQYRILYEVEGKNIGIVKIDRRSKVY